jgi:hypothetical protein
MSAHEPESVIHRLLARVCELELLLKEQEIAQEQFYRDLDELIESRLQGRLLDYGLIEQQPPCRMFQVIPGGKTDAPPPDAPGAA